MDTIKKTAVTGSLIVMLFTLSGCINFFGEEETTDTTTTGNSSIYQTNDFQISIPTDWEVIDENDFTSDVPGETVVVFRNNVKNETFTGNVNIVRRNFQESLNSLEYANLVNNRQKLGLTDYNEISKEDMKMKIGDNEKSTYFTTFEARKSSNEMLIRYVQTYGVSGNSAYIVTGSFSPNEKEGTVQTIENIVKSFQLK